MASNDHACELAKIIITKFEGVRLRPYLCPAGVPTIGIGATFYESGAHVTLHDAPITQDRAEALLTWHVQNVFLPAVLKLCPVSLSDGQLAALIDFAFNLGANNLKASTLRRKVNAGLWADVPYELRKWVYSNGKQLPGLIARRQAEIDLL